MLRLSALIILGLLPQVQSAFTPIHCVKQCTTSHLPDSSQVFCRHNDNDIEDQDETAMASARRSVLMQSSALVASMVLGKPATAFAASAAVQDSVDIETFLRTGVDIGGGMTVSSQAGKSRPQTGVVFRDGSEVNQDKNGNVLAELLVGTKANPKAVLISFNSPWVLQTGPVFDVECRDGASGDGAFVAVTKSVEGKSIEDLPSSFFLERLFDPTARFSFYGPPTDVKVKSSKVEGKYRYIELSFSYLSQSTNAEIPRKAVAVATVPAGTENAIMLVASATSARWKKGSEQLVRQTVDSFRAIPAPPSNLKLRPKDRGLGTIDFS